MHDLTTLITHWQEPPAHTYNRNKALTQDVIFLQITTLNSDHLSCTADISALARQYTAQTADQKRVQLFDAVDDSSLLGYPCDNNSFSLDKNIIL